MVTRNYFLERLAAAIREYYIQVRRRFEEARTGQRSNYTPGAWWDGGLVPGSNSYRKNYWLRLASCFSDCELDYRAFIDYVFENHTWKYLSDRTRYAPQPNMLGSQSLLNEFKRVQASGDQLVHRRRTFDSQRAEARSAILKYQQYGLYTSSQELLSAVLTDSSLQLSALFRFCVARREGLTKIADFYRDQALCQYSRGRQDYDKIWGQWIPTELKKQLDVVNAR